MTKADKEGQRKAPILRFKGFTDDWEQRKLKNLITEPLSYGLSVSSKEYDGIHKYLHITDIDEKSRKFNKDKLTSPDIKFNSSSKKYLLSNNDIVFARTGASTGKTYMYQKEDGIVYYAGFLIKASLSSNFDNNFIFQQTYRKRYYQRVKVISQRSGQPGINSKEYGNFDFLITQIEEQNKIGKLFKIFDNLLTLYERKTRLLSKLRTFLTQRLFSNSSKISLYFDNKNWSKHKISEFLTERNEKVIPNPSIPLVSFTVEKGVTPKSKRYNREFLVKDDKKKYKITKKNDIVYNPANLKFGAIARNKFGNAAFSPIYVTFITKLNPVFTEFLVRRKDFIKLALKYQEGTVYERMAVKSKDFLSLKIYLPNSSRDINHIAQILQSLDTLVSLNKNKISLITLIKKELLNTMFI